MVGKSTISESYLENSLAVAGANVTLRNAIFDSLRKAEIEAVDNLYFRNHVRWPLINALLRDVKDHQITLDNGLIFEIGTESRIERSLLLSTSLHPDHVWEPQTTKLLVTLGRDAENVIIGGTYIGDQALLISKAITEKKTGGIIHGFEPDTVSFNRLLHHLEINSITNVLPYQLGLWESSDIALKIEGEAGLATTAPVGSNDKIANKILSISIDDYIKSKQLQSVGLIMLDTEGAEEKALLGASNLLSRPYPHAPHLIFEVNRNYIDWSFGLENTSVVKYVMSMGYQVFAIRDFHDNFPMAEKEIEIIPVKEVYLEGPPHGFNMLATKDSTLIARLGLRLVNNVSPKLLIDKNPSLHHPLSGL
jgi:FkbM family methyltransferase